MPEQIPEQRYRVVLTGRQLIEDIEKIRVDVQSIFDLPQAQLNALVSGKPLTIKKNILAPQALKFKKALNQCGLECLVESMADEPLLSAGELDEHKENQESVTPEKPSLSSVKSKTHLVMAPAGARIGPRASTQQYELPSVDHLQAEMAERLAPISEPGPPPPNVDHLNMGPDKGMHDRLSPETAAGPPPPNVDYLNLDKPGALLSSEKKVKPLELDLSHLKLD